MSDTPRTEIYILNPYPTEVVPAEFARELERENATLKARIAELTEWRPMDTAPYDGLTWILGHEDDSGETGIIIFDSNPEQIAPDEHADVWTDGYREWNPTEWKPIPLPTSKGESNE